MSDQYAGLWRPNGGDTEYVDKATGNVAFALRTGNVVDMSAASSILMPGNVANNVASLLVTTAQIKALHGTPKTVIAAQGAGTLIWVVDIIYEFIYGTAVFATSTGVIGLYYGSGGQVIGTNGLAAAITTGSASALVSDIPVLPGTTAGIVPSTALNTAVVIQNPSATEYTSATGTSTILVKVAYRVYTGLT